MRSRVPSPSFRREAHSSLDAAIDSVHFEAELREAPRDPLTGLPDRSVFVRRLRTRLGRGAAAAVVVLDLDGFRTLNREIGFEAADRLLGDVALRLQSSLRCGDMVCRLGGDAFGVLLAEVTGPEHAVSVARRLLEAAGAEWSVDGRVLRPTASVGVAVAVEGSRPEDLLRAAERALDRARAVGTGVECEDPTADPTTLTLSHLETALRRALGDKEFREVYEPCVAAKTGKVVGFEVLLWRRPKPRPARVG